MGSVRQTYSIDIRWVIDAEVSSEVLDIRDGTHDSPKYIEEGYPLVTSKNVVDGRVDLSNTKLISKEDLDNINKRSKVDLGDILMPMIGTIGRPTIVDFEKDFAIKNVALIKCDNEIILSGYVRAILDSQHFITYISQNERGSTQKFISLGALRSFPLHVPPLEVQQEIVNELEGYQKIIDGCKQVVENYKPTIDIDPSWEMVELGEICDVGSSKRIYKNEYVLEGVPFYRTKEVVELNKGKDISLELFISRDRFEEIREKYGRPQKDDILISAVGTIGISWVVDRDFDFYFKDGNLLWLRNISSDVQSIFLKTVFDSIFKSKKDSLVAGSAYNALTIITLKNFKVPMPSTDIQEEIVQKIEEERKVIEGNKKLIEIYTQKIQDRINKVWGEE